MCLLAPGPTEQFAPLCNCDTPQEFIGRGLFFKWAQYLKLCWVCAHESLCMHEQNQSSNPNRSFKYWISRAAEDVTFTGAHKDTHACFFFFLYPVFCVFILCALWSMKLFCCLKRSDRWLDWSPTSLGRIVWGEPMRGTGEQRTVLRDWCPVGCRLFRWQPHVSAQAGLQRLLDLCAMWVAKD